MTPEQVKSTRNTISQSTFKPAPGSLMAYASGFNRQPEPSLRQLLGAPRYSLLFGGFRAWNSRRLIGF